jgi:hypothetical protein
MWQRQLLCLFWLLAMAASTHAKPCEKWLRIFKRAGVTPPKATSDTDFFEAAECLLSAQGGTGPSEISGATTPNVSQVLPRASVQLAALYYLSFLFTENWSHASGIALWDDEGRINPEGSTQRAFAAYRTWLKEVKKVGLARAKKSGLNPLLGSGLLWYGN